MPGAPTGLERWAAWGAREEGMAVRMRAWRGEDVGLESGLGAAKDSEGVAGRKDEEKAVVWGGREPFGGGDMVRQAQQVLVFVHGEEAAQRMTGARGRGLPLGSAIGMYVCAKSARVRTEYVQFEHGPLRVMVLGFHENTVQCGTHDSCG